jgi:hypothetical protein
MKLRGMFHHAAESFASEMRRNGNFFDFVEMVNGTNDTDAISRSLKTSPVTSSYPQNLHDILRIRLANTFEAVPAP